MEKNDQIKQIFDDSCPAMSGFSTLYYGIGKHEVDGTLHLRINRNSGNGRVCSEWASASDIDAIAEGSMRLTGMHFYALHPDKSRNTGAFILAALLHLGLVRRTELDSRFCEQVPGATFSKRAMARMAEPKLVVPVPAYSRPKPKVD
ncbi:hypothetical protein [Ottowia thiooxydans]|uniref:hypothetical protein n=1 Tax=Ottowia thiooxydans TaxID=219182 RepID=UPI000411CA56|nr:hypothetical protein [Ottowia thiooxydans]